MYILARERRRQAQCTESQLSEPAHRPQKKAATDEQNVAGYQTDMEDTCQLVTTSRIPLSWSDSEPDISIPSMEPPIKKPPVELPVELIRMILHSVCLEDGQLRRLARQPGNVRAAFPHLQTVARCSRSMLKLAKEFERQVFIARDQRSLRWFMRRATKGLVIRTRVLVFGNELRKTAKFRAEVVEDILARAHGVEQLVLSRVSPWLSATAFTTSALKGALDGSLEQLR